MTELISEFSCQSMGRLAGSLCDKHPSPHEQRSIVYLNGCSLRSLDVTTTKDVQHFKQHHLVGRTYVFTQRFKN